MARKTSAFLAIAVSSAFPNMAFAGDDIPYHVVKGDTLIALGEKYLLRPSDYRIVQKNNRIGNPNMIPVGKTINFPRHLLKYEAAKARFIAVRGGVSSVQGSTRVDAKTGNELQEGAAVQTAAGAFATLALDDGSRVSLPSNSDVKIVRLRKYYLGSALDYDFRVQKGGTRSKVAPLQSKNDRYQVRTPKAVSAVRGTDFQTRVDETSGNDFAEVDEGALAVDLTNGQSAAVGAGFGLAVTANGEAISEALLPAVTLADAGKLQNNPAVQFALPGDGKSYRLSVATDAGFIEQIADVLSKSDSADIGALDDGNYFLRVRQLSSTGIEGQPAVYTFKRRLNSVSGNASSTADGWVFRWAGVGKGTIRYHFQLVRGLPENAPFVDEAGLSVQQLSLSDLPPGDYHWRIGSVQFLDGESDTNWTPFEKFTVTAD
jgi:hypothetical protein